MNTLFARAFLLARFALCGALVSSIVSFANAASIFTDANLTAPGLVGTYINRNLQNVTTSDDWRVSQSIAGTRTDATLSFTTGTWGARAPVGITGGSDGNWENFSVQWDGWLRITQAGDRVGLASDDGSRMWIDLDGNAVFEPGELLDNGWGRTQGVTAGGRSAGLPVGSYRIRIQYYEGSGGNEFHLTTSPWAPRQFVPAPGNPRQTVRVLVLNFEPRIPSEGNRRLWEVFNWNDPRVLATQFANDLEFATGGAIDVQIVEMRHLEEFPVFVDGFRYAPEQYVQNRRTNTGWHTGPADFYRLAEEQNLTALVNSGQIDEIWCFGDHFFELFGEAWMAGPGSFFINGPSFPKVGFDRAIAGYGFNYERSVAEMMHNLAHRTENHGQRAFGNWNLANPITAFDQFSANYLDSPSRTAGVGTCHVPANANEEYDYGNTRVVQSTAFDWANYPAVTGATTAVSRATWGMGPSPEYHRDYMNFYFGMMPRNAGAAPDGRQANWFKYIWDFNSYEPGTGLPRGEDAFASAVPVRVAGGTSHDFTIRFYDQTGIDTSTLDGNDAEVETPGGARLQAQFVGAGAAVATTAGTARTFTYRFTPPGGAWDSGDAGTYRVHLKVNQVRDTLGNAVPAGEVGSFEVDIKDPALLDVQAALASGEASVTHTTLDIGPITRLFDNDTTTLIRTPNIDPAVVTLTFTSAHTFHGFRIFFSHASGDPAYRWQIETGDSLADLNAKSGTWRQAVAQTGAVSDSYASVTLATPITARLARLTATRLTGDNYVHINEWQLLGPPVVNTAPTISETLDQHTYRNVPLGPVPFTITAPDGGESAAVVVASSSNLALVPTEGIVLGGAGANRTVTITPRTGAIGNTVITLAVADQDGDQAHDSFSVTVLADDGGSGFVPQAGTFSGLINPGGSFATSGWFLVKSTTRGNVSGKLVLGGQTFGFSGAFNSSGDFSKEFARKGLAALTLRLQARGNEIIGTLSDTGAVFPLAGRIASLHTKKNPAAQAGNFTARLLPPDAEPPATRAGFPQAPGIATLSVAASGSVRIAGWLADGTVISLGSKLRADGTLPLFAPLYQGKGAIAGDLEFAGPDSATGYLTWIKPTRQRDKLYPAGFDLDLAASVARFIKPPQGLRVIAAFDATNGQASLGFSHPADFVPPTLTLPIVIKANNGATPAIAGNQKLTLSINASSGLITGKLLAPTVPPKTLPFRLVIDQSAASASGFILGPTETGEVTLVPN